MKTLKILLIIVFATSLLSVAAQSNEAQRPISKEIQKIINRKMLLDERHLTVESLNYPAWTISKNVQILNTDTDVRDIAGNIPSKGYPIWLISKGVYKRTVTN